MLGREAYHNPWLLASWDQQLFGAPQRAPAVAHARAHSGSLFQNELEWLPVLAVLATPWLSMQFMSSVEQKHDPPLMVAMIMIAVT